MGQTESQSNIEQDYNIIKVREDGSALLQHKKSYQEFLLRSVCSNIGEEINCFEDMLRKRQQVRSQHLLDLVQIRRKEEKNVCSVAHKMYLLIEFPFKSLKDQIMDKISQNSVIPFLEAELWSILYSCCVGMHTLYDNKMPHESLTSSQIYINRQGIIKISDPILLGLQKNYIKVLKNSNQHVQISPEIINFLDDCNFSFYDKEKSDIFVLGAIMLQASLLRSIQLFDQQTKKPYLDIIPQALKQTRQRYSQPFCEMLQKMLHLHSRMRPKFSDIISAIEKDNSLYESTDETSIQQMTQTGPLLSNNTRNSQSQKTLPRPAWNQGNGERVDRNAGGSSFNYRTVQKTDGGNLQSGKINQMPNDTIIKLLQTQSLNKSQSYTNSHMPSPNPMYLPQPQPQMVYQPVRPVLLQQNFPSNSVPGQPQFTKPSHPNPFPTISNARPPTARLNQVDDRFSYTKFGNIVLTQPQVAPKTKPLFSYDIPEINQILRSQAVLQGNRGRDGSRVQFGHVQTPIVQNQVPMQVRVQTQPQPLTKSPSQPSFQQSPPQPMKSKQPPSPIGQQKQPQPQLQPPKPINPEVPPTQQPEKPKKQSQNGSSHTKHSDSQLQKGNKLYTPSGKISLNGILKENQMKKHYIYPVTEKSEENLETSPVKLNSSNNESPIRLKQPQKSPGLSVKKSPSNQKPSSKKSIKSPEAQKQSKYVVMIIEGGGRYEGMVKNGMKNGEGKLEFNDGGFYVGEWKNNKMHGFGKLHYENGQVAYEGQWENDQFCGEGRVFNDRPETLLGPFNYYDFADLGEKWIYYQGEFKNDSKHGRGKMRLTNGEVFEGNFVFDSIEGQGIFYTIRGEAIRGSWTDNMLTQG